MEYLYDLKEMLCQELKDIVRKGELSAGSLETVDKLTHSLKSILAIMAMEEGGGSYEGSYENSGRSGARRRDSMGRYADGGSYYGRSNEGGGSGYSGRRRYSREEGQSQMVQQLESLMREANPDEREVMEQALKQLKNM